MGQTSTLFRLRTIARPSTWALEPEPSTFAENSGWSNKDMDPVPPHQRTWTMLDYVTFWISCAVNVTTWQLGSSMLAVGLSWCGLCCLVDLFFSDMSNPRPVGAGHFLQFSLGTLS